MTDLIEKLRVAIDEDERVAQEANDDDRRSWVAINADEAFHMEDPLVGYRDELGAVASGMDKGQANHIAHCDPARMLRQVTAMRKMLELHALDRPFGKDMCTTCLNLTSISDPITSTGWPCPTLLTLAEAYGIEP